MSQNVYTYDMLMVVMREVIDASSGMSLPALCHSWQPPAGRGVTSGERFLFPHSSPERSPVLRALRIFLQLGCSAKAVETLLT